MQHADDSIRGAELSFCVFAEGHRLSLMPTGHTNLCRAADHYDTRFVALTLKGLGELCRLPPESRELGIVHSASGEGDTSYCVSDFGIRYVYSASHIARQAYSSCLERESRRARSITNQIIGIIASPSSLAGSPNIEE
jgi:hypothetical protein